MELFHQRIENTTRLIKSFKTDQERQILKSRNDMSAKFKLTKSSRVNGSRISINEGSVTSMLNTDCIIMPYCLEASSYKKLWPQSLIVNRSNNCAEVGQIESHGSLWKLVPCNDAAPGSRVMLQTSVSHNTSPKPFPKNYLPGHFFYRRKESCLGTLARNWILWN